MSVTFGSMAQVAVKTSMLAGNAQANSLGLGKQEANAMALNNLLMGQVDKNLFSTYMDTMHAIHGDGESGLGLSSSRLRGSGLTNDLMAIGKAAMMGSGKSSTLLGGPSTGGILSTKV